jgi:hypothetical protein
MEWERCPEREALRRLRQASMDRPRPMVAFARAHLGSGGVREDSRRDIQQRLTPHLRPHAGE